MKIEVKKNLDRKSVAGKLYLNKLYGSAATGTTSGFAKEAEKIAEKIADVPGFIYADTDSVYCEEESEG